MIGAKIEVIEGNIFSDMMIYCNVIEVPIEFWLITFRKRSSELTIENVLVQLNDIKGFYPSLDIVRTIGAFNLPPMFYGYGAKYLFEALEITKMSCGEIENAHDAIKKYITIGSIHSPIEYKVGGVDKILFPLTLPPSVLSFIFGVKYWQHYFPIVYKNILSAGGRKFFNDPLIEWDDLSLDNWNNNYKFSELRFKSIERLAELIGVQWESLFDKKFQKTNN